jgi:hypothetical protein
MKDILKLNPKDRLSTIDALRHPYFKGLNEEFLKDNKINKSNKTNKSNKSNKSNKNKSK